MTKGLNLAGKDFLNEAEAAYFCGVSVPLFQRSSEVLIAYGVKPRHCLGRRLFARAELAHMIEQSKTWYLAERPCLPRTSVFPDLRSGRLRPHRPRKNRIDGSVLEVDMTDIAFNLAGKDWFREDEAAEYCGVSERHFQREIQPHIDAGAVTPRCLWGRKLYSRDELLRMVERAPAWHGSRSLGAAVRTIAGAKGRSNPYGSFRELGVSAIEAVQAA